MLTTRKDLNVPLFDRQASFMPETFDEKARTIDVIFSTGARVKRNTFFGMGEDFIEELSLARNHVRLDRLNNGASVLNNHNSQSLADVLGVVEKARLTKGEDGKAIGLATLRFSSRAEVQPIVEDIKSGVIRNISVGYQVHKFEEQEATADGVRVFRATDWEPAEISFVTVPADSGAKVRGSQLSNVCNFTLRGENVMSVVTEKPEMNQAGDAPAKVTAQGANVEEIRGQAEKAERERILEIREACKSMSLSDEFATKLVTDGTEISAARKAIIAERAKNEPTTRSAVEVITNEGEHVQRGMLEALLHRSNGSRNKLTDLGRQFRGMSLIDMVRTCLENSGVNVRGMSKDEMVRKSFELRLRAGMHSSSDFPQLLENLVNKTLRDSYRASPNVYAPLVREVTAPDFKQVSRVQLGDAPDLDLLPEGMEIQAGKVGQGYEKYSLETYAKMVRISRKAIVNDDLDAFTRLPENFGRRAAQKEGDLVWGVILDNALLSDGVALFSLASHNNLQTAAAIAIASLGIARSAMRKQKGIGDDSNPSRISLAPSWLFVPPELETVADQFVTTITPDAAGSVNPFANRLKVAVEPRLSDTSFNASASALAWYLTADTAQVDILELCRLQGEEGPVIESEDMFDVEGMKIKCRIDLAAKAIDYRGLQKNPGL